MVADENGRSTSPMLLQTRTTLNDVFRVPLKLSNLGVYGSFLSVPMLKENELIGAFTVYRQEVRPFTDKQIALVTSFASQAVIAIENARLLNELRESLAQQTATSKVLGIISSSPGELKPVFQAMLENAVRICDAKFGFLFLSEGDAFRAVALHDVPPAYAEARRREPVTRFGPGTATDRAARTKQPVQIADVKAEPAYVNDPQRFAIVELAGARTVLSVPMLKENELVGVIGIYRQEVRPFTDKQIELVQELRRPGGHRHRERAAAQRATRISSSNRPPPPMCSRSSAARPSICRRCSTR